MQYLQVEQLSKTHADHPLFTNINFHIHAGEKIALIAANGTGKTSLLNIIAGLDIPDHGEVNLNKEVDLIYLKQNMIFDYNASILDYVFDQDHPTIQAVKQYEDSLAYPEKYSSEELETILSKMDQFEAWDLDTRVKEILSKLKITNLDQPIDELSGGQLKRINLAKSLLHVDDDLKHYLLLLDEPTNHLDIEMIEWLEQYLSKPHITLLLVSHDRYFVDEVCDTIFELDQQKLYIIKGNYEKYLEQKAIRYEQQSLDQSKAMNRYLQELEWMRKQPRARGTKSKKREERFYDWQDKALKQQDQSKLSLEIQMTRLGNKVVTLEHVYKSFGDKKILEDFSYNFTSGEKIGIIGPNGVGKSTFINIIQELEPIDQGVIETGSTVSFGYFSQESIFDNHTERVIDYVKSLADIFPLQNGKYLTASQFLEKFLFSKEKQYQYINRLSGGEKKRLHLLSVVFQNPNFLILDEPTNDLDLPTLEVLENFLLEYPGCVLIISHDRYFMDRVIDHLLVFRGAGKIEDFPGNFSEFRIAEEIKQQSEESFHKEMMIPKPAHTPNNTSKSQKRLGFNEKRELTQITQELPILEEQKKALEEQLNKGNLDFEELQSLSEALHKISEELDQKEMRWLELSELS